MDDVVRALTGPSKKRINAICQELSQMTQRRFQWKPVKTMVEEMNRPCAAGAITFALERSAELTKR
jgi:hypothetical protein